MSEGLSNKNITFVMKKDGKNRERREKTRKNMLAAASRGFRSRGFSGIGVDAIAKDAGATSGAFYAHFGSKDGAFLAAVEQGLAEVIEGISKFQKEDGEHWVEALAEYYLGPTHRNNLSCGCSMTALSPDVIKQDKDTQELHARMMNEIVDLMASGLAGGTLSQKRERAWRLLSLLIGGLTLCRSMNADANVDSIANALTRSAIEAAKPTRSLQD